MIYSVAVSPGLEKIAHQEIIARFGNTKQFKILLRKPQRIVFQFTGNPKELFALRTPEDLLLIVKHVRKMTRSRHSLTTIRNAISRLDLKSILQCCRQVDMRLRKRVSFRVICRMSGQRNFQKRDLQQVIERVFIDRGWYLTQSDSGLDVLVDLHGEDVYISIRISKKEWTERVNKQLRVKHSIKSTIAYGMVSLSQPHPNDIFLDPMCGAGTILLERALSGRYRYLIGGDISLQSIAATKANFGRQHQPRQFFLWDAQKMPILPNTVDKIVSNMIIDHGLQNTTSEMTNFYKKCVNEFETVLKPKGKMVLLTLEPLLLDRQLKQQNALIVRRKVSVDVGRKRGRIFVVYHK